MYGTIYPVVCQKTISTLRAHSEGDNFLWRKKTLIQRTIQIFTENFENYFHINWKEEIRTWQKLDWQNTENKKLRKI